MRLSLTHTLSASLIGAFFMCSPIQSAYAQSLESAANAAWQTPADVLTLAHPGRVQTKISKTAAQNTIEVVEFFSYTCPHCAHFAPKLNTWRAQQPADVHLIYLPVSWRPDMVAPQRLFFTLQGLHRLDLHEQVFADWANDPEHLATDAAVLNWALRQGFDPKTWQTAYRSAAVTQNMRAAQQAFRRFELNGVPALVVNGRYSLIPSEQVLDTLDQVVAHERVQKP